MALWKAPTTNYVSTSLNGAINDSVDTITLTSTTGMQAPGYIVIDREDGSGTATPTSREVVSFTGISSNDLTGCTRGADNSTARSHSDGALVETMPTVGMWNDTYSVINAEHDTDGTHSIIANATITDARVENLYSSNGTVALSQASITHLDVDTSAISMISASTIATDALIMGDSAPNINVRFSAHLSGVSVGLTQASEATIAFNCALYDSGNDYDSSTGVFTAPVDGYYAFDANLAYGVTADADILLTSIYVNGAVVGTNLVQAGGSSSVSCGVSKNIYLSANDEVCVVANNLSNNDSLAIFAVRHYFNGHLLSV